MATVPYRAGLGRRVFHMEVLIALGLSAGGGQTPSQADLGRMELEDLMQIKVTSVSKREQNLSRTAGGSIPGHTRLDLRLARRLGESAEISLVGQNLLRPRST